MKALNVLLAITVSLLLGLAVFEGGLRLFPQFRPQVQINEFHPTLGWAKKPNFRVERSTGEFDITFETNSEGLRDDPLQGDSGEPRAKDPNTYRVMCLGDSFVLGFTVDREDLFVDHLERWWIEENRRVDVINAGTEGYSTDQAVAWFLDEGVDFAPDLVLLFPYENDIYWNGQPRYTRYPKPLFRADGTRETGTLEDPGPGSALQSWAAGKALGMLAGALRGGAGPNHIEVEGMSRPLYAEFAPLLVNAPDLVEPCLQRTKGALIALKERCDSIYAELVMVPIPSESVVDERERAGFAEKVGLDALGDDAWDPNLPVEHFLGLAREVGIEALDPRDRLIAENMEGPLYFEQEWHFNPRGNEVFARYLHEELNRMDVFPPEHSATKESPLTVTKHEDGGLPTWVIVYGTLLLVLGTMFKLTYADEPLLLAYLKVAVLLAMVFALFMGLASLMAAFPTVGQILTVLFVVGILVFVLYKLGRRVGTIMELLQAFTLRGHWYLMPLVVVLLSIGSLLVVAASSPLVAPFIYTLF